MGSPVPLQSTSDEEPEASVTALELFFDLVFVFAFTQVSGFLALHLSWAGVARGAALLAVLWWAWVCYSWLTGVVPAEQSLPARLIVLTAMMAMLFAALAVPDAFGDDALLFGLAYLVVRLLHVVFYYIVAPPDTRDAVRRMTPGFLGGPLLLVVASAVTVPLQSFLWIAAIALDYGIVFVRGVAGFHVTPRHFVERYRLVVIVALGESIIAIGIGATGLTLGVEKLLAVFLGMALVIAIWWLYFDYVILAAEQQLMAAPDEDRTVLARDLYSVLHLVIVGSIIFMALGIEQTLGHAAEPLSVIAAVALCGGGALYLLGQTVFQFRDHGTISTVRFIGVLVAFALIPIAIRTTALVGLAALTVLFVAIGAYETRYSEDRRRVRMDPHE